MGIGKLLENHPFEVESCVNAELQTVILGEEGLSQDPFTGLDAIVVLEDRQHFARAGRGSRFQKADLTRTFGFARNVVIICFSRAGRVGQGHQDYLHHRALTKVVAQGGLTVAILTTRSRIGHWQSNALSLGHAQIRCFDNAGVSLISRDYGAAA
ncbi:MAG: hypothetical protein MEQ84_11815 [Mesorhizobium sp.]|nr:hypothetical protein [Mesorhizobium sp.]